ncbi:hypothetical protein R6Q59_024957 [Mikania micrantha]
MQEKILGRRTQCQVLEGLHFCTERTKEAYEEYLQEMIKEYELNFTQDDARVWERLHGNGGPKRVFGIGSSDLDFVFVTNVSQAGEAEITHLSQMCRKNRCVANA